MSEQPAVIIDTIGERCPTPVIQLASRIGEVGVGEVVAVLSDDEAARLDIPAWCRMREQEYVGERELDGAPAYLVKRLS